MITFHQVNDKWMLVHGLRWLQSNAITGTRSRSGNGRWTFDGCWTGERWASQTHFGMKFDSQEAAALYLEENESQMTI